jgi:hypothetical protein
VFTTGRAFDRYYIAMELVPGGHLEGRIEERGNIPEREMLPLAIQVAQGLKAAHAAGLIHRDVKPGNILLDAAGNAKIADFGLSLLLDQAGRATATEIWATPYYVPPETIEGQAEDFRSDMYAFGATVYHALAGKPPCNEESMSTPVLREAKRKIIPLQQAAGWITARTCAVVDRAMAYNPVDRFGSYDELLSYLNDALAQLKAGAKPIVRDPRAAKRRQAAQRRARILIAAGLAAVAAVIGASIWWLRQPGHAGPAPADPAPSAVPGAPAPEQDAAAAVRIAKVYREAREAAAAGEFAAAGTRFAALRDDPAVGEPTRTWSAVEAVLMALLDGQSGAARSAAAAAAAHLANPTAPPAIGRLLLPVLREFHQAVPITVGDDDDLRGQSVTHLMRWMLAGLKNWDQGRLAAAAPFFQAVADARVAPGDEWATIYPSLAADYLADFKTLSSPVFAAAPADRQACDRARAELTAMLPALKTRGRARFNVIAWQEDLAKLAPTLPDATPATPPATPELQAVLATLADYAERCDFAAAADYLAKLPEDPDGATRKALKSLADSAAKLLQNLDTDLKRNPAGISLSGTLKSGETFTKIAATSRSGVLQVNLGGPLRDCRWADLTPEAVIDLYRVVIKAETDTERKYRRHETAVAFQWLAGDRAQAMATAKRIAAENEGFAERWEALKAGLPAP